MRAADGIWAIGDVTNHGGFTHLAVYQGRIAAADILGDDHAPADYSAQVLAILVVTVGAIEMAIGLALVLLLYRQRRTVEVDAYTDLNG